VHSVICCHQTKYFDQDYAPPFPPLSPHLFKHPLPYLHRWQMRTSRGRGGGEEEDFEKEVEVGDLGGGGGGAGSAGGSGRQGGVMICHDDGVDTLLYIYCVPRIQILYPVCVRTYGCCSRIQQAVDSYWLSRHIFLPKIYPPLKEGVKCQACVVCSRTLLLKFMTSMKFTLLNIDR